MIIKPLDTIEFNDLISCFLKAFENYYVTMPTDAEYYRKRWEAAKVDYSLSYGMFDNNKLVGFIVHAIDTRKGIKTAYNTGTGVIPDYRGKSIVKLIYDYAIPKLLKQNITKLTLEVITENVKAIKAYEGVGFRISKTYKCYSGEIQTSDNANTVVKSKSIGSVIWEQLPNQDKYSWDFQSETVKEGNYTYHEVYYYNTLESFFIINPSNGYIAQFDTFNNNSKAWTRLFSSISQTLQIVKIINIDARLDSKLNYINTIGLTNTVNQYEMEMMIG